MLKKKNKINLNQNIPVEELMSKICNKCGRDLPLSEYHKNRTNLDGLHVRCKDCRNKLARDNAQKAITEDNGQTKLCQKCGQMKPVSKYFQSAIEDDGLFHRCVDCLDIKFDTTYMLRDAVTGEQQVHYARYFGIDVKPIM